MTSVIRNFISFDTIYLLVDLLIRLVIVYYIVYIEY